MQRGTRTRIVVVVGAGLVGVWLVAVAWLLLGARRETAAGAADLRQVRAEATVSSLSSSNSRARLRSASAHFDSAEAAVDSVVLAPLRLVPVVSRHLRASQQLVDGAQQGTDAARAALGSLSRLTARSGASGPARVTSLRELAAVAGRAQRSLDAVDPGSPDGLIGPLGRSVAELDEQRTDAAAAAGRLRATSLALAEVLDGPDSYLLLGANNAEMRNGSGMFLSASELRFDRGRLRLGAVRPTAELVLPAGAVRVSGDLAANWSWLDPGRDLRNLGLTADFPQSAEVAARTWAAVPGGGRVDGVISIDVDGLRSLLHVVGPVEVDGVRYTADTVRGELLRKQYQRFGADRSARRDQLGEVARAVFDRIEAGDWTIESLATELVDAVQGRHLLIWSRDAAMARAWRAAGADGHLGDHSLAIGLVNRGANKLDSWVDVAASVSTKAAEGGRRRVTVDYEVDNRAPAGGPPYVVGPNVAGLAEGAHSALVVANLPAGTIEVTMDGAEVFLRGGDGPTVVIGGRLTVPRGATAHVRVTGLLPVGLDRVTLEPSARIDKTTWQVDGRELSRDRRRDLIVT